MSKVSSASTRPTFETIPSSLSFIASLAHDTKQMKLKARPTESAQRHRRKDCGACGADRPHARAASYWALAGVCARTGVFKKQSRADRTRDVRRMHRPHLGDLERSDPPYDIKKSASGNISTQRTMLGREARNATYLQALSATASANHHHGGRAEFKGFRPRRLLRLDALSANFIHPNWVATHIAR